MLVNPVHEVTTRHYAGHMRALGDHFRQRAAVIPSVSADPDAHLSTLVQVGHRHAVQISKRYYTLMNIAAGHDGFYQFPEVSLHPLHIAAALRKGAESQNGDVPGAVHNLIMNGGRDLVIGASAIDPAAEGWYRIPDDGACDYCVRQGGPGVGDFPSHYNCGCVAAPRFMEAQ